MDGLIGCSSEEAEEAYEMAKEIPYLIGLFETTLDVVSAPKC